MDLGSSRRESKDRCVKPGTFRLRPGGCLGNPDAKDHSVDSKRASGAKQHGVGRTEATGLESRQMGSARPETKGAFRLCHAALTSQVAHSSPECAREFFRAVHFVLFVREGERYVTDAERSPAASARRGEGAELDETACRAADGIKPYINSQGMLL